MHQLGYVLHRVNDRFMPHKTRAYRMLDRVAGRLYGCTCVPTCGEGANHGG